MCGIVGRLNFDYQDRVSPDLIRAMTGEISYRGPNDEGVWVKDNIGLGHRRLSIIDLSPAGHQPMCNEDRSVWITFNGEIYNFPELKENLLSLGHKFASHTDTEVIIHLYEEYGIDSLSHLRGMFAFAIWDDRKKRLLLARDRMGKKPLKYYADDRGLVFASELKSILKDPQVKTGVDRQAIDAYLTYQYVPHPMTGFKNIQKLPQAHYLIWQDGHITVNRYWALDFSNKLNLPEAKVKEGILENLMEAVNLRLISDVPLGAALSGGVDSSAIVASMSQLMEQPVRTFSVGFEDDNFNELPYARLISEKFKTRHQEITVKPSTMDILPKLVWHYEEPYADASALPTYYLFSIMKPHITVALSGEAGDENFAGYHRYLRLKQLAQYQRLPLALRSYGIESLLSLLFSLTGRHAFLSALQHSKAVAEDLVNGYLHILSCFLPQEKRELYADDFRAQCQHYDAGDFIRRLYNQPAAGKGFDRVLYVDFNSYLPDDLMVKTDIASMIHSLECRVPMLDHKFLEFVAQIPFEYKLRNNTRKYILKKSLEGMLPNEILYRKKMGFSVPVDGWFRHELKDFAYGHLLSPTCLDRGYFKAEAIRRLLDEHTQGRRDHGYKIWTLLWLELWHRAFSL